MFLLSLNCFSVVGPREDPTSDTAQCLLGHTQHGSTLSETAFVLPPGEDLPQSTSFDSHQATWRWPMPVLPVMTLDDPVTQHQQLWDVFSVRCIQYQSSHLGQTRCGWSTCSLQRVLQAWGQGSPQGASGKERQSKWCQARLHKGHVDQVCWCS